MTRPRKTGIVKAIRHLGRNFLRSSRGAAAVEFAFIVPILITLYLGSMELSQALDVDVKVSRTANMVADLVTQQDAVSQSQLVSIMKIGEATLQPYNRDTPTITIVAVQVDSSTQPKAQIAWSIRRHGSTVTTPYAAGTVVTLPERLTTAGAFVVEVNAELEYIPVTTWSIKATSTSNGFASIPMKETYYLRPRLTNTIDCTDCG